MTYVLRFQPTSKSGLGYWQADDRPRYFTYLGGQWPHAPEKRYIEGVTTDPGQAKAFDTEEAAREIYAIAGMPPGWAVEEA